MKKTVKRGRPKGTAVVKKEASLPIPAKVVIQGGTLEKLVLRGDLSGMSAQETMEYYLRFCEHLGLDPVTRPFDILQLQGKRVLYAHKGCTDQLRKKYGVSVTDIRGEVLQDAYRVTALGRDHTGRTDAATGIVKIKGLEGDAFANACMKAETKAKRRLTLSLCGLGMLDETEIETISGAQPMTVNLDATTITATVPQSVVYDITPVPEEKPKPVFDKRAWLKGRYLRLCRSKWLSEDDKTVMKNKMKMADKNLNTIETIVKDNEAIATAMAQAAGDASYKEWTQELEAAVEVGEIEL